MRLIGSGWVATSAKTAIGKCVKPKDSFNSRTVEIESNGNGVQFDFPPGCGN